MSNIMEPQKRNAKFVAEANVFSDEMNEAIIRNNKIGVEEQLSRGASLEALNSRGQTPLQVAIENRNLNVVKIIVDNGADIHRETRFGTPFYYAATLGSTDLLEYFLNKKVNVNVRNRNGETALHATCRNQQLSDLETCAFLLKHGADPTLENEKKETPLYCAYQQLRPICESLFALVRDDEKFFSSSQLQKLVAAVNFISEFLNYGVDLGNILLECPMIFRGAVIAENVKLVKYLTSKNKNCREDCSTSKNSMKYGQKGSDVNQKYQSGNTAYSNTFESRSCTRRSGSGEDAISNDDDFGDEEYENDYFNDTAEDESEYYKNCLDYY